MVHEQVEVREVGVVADLPGSLRGRTADDLAKRIVIVEGGVKRQPMSVSGLGGGGTSSYSRVLIVFDTERCSAEVLHTAGSALGAAAAQLVALGPVEVDLLGERLETRLDATLSSSTLAAALSRVAREAQCGTPPPADRLTRIELDAAQLSCPETPCLLVWAGPGWGRSPGAGGARATPPSDTEVDPFAERLATHGWVVLAAPITPTPEGESKRYIEEPRTEPGSDQHTFGVNVLDRHRKQPLSPQEYSKFVDIWMAPLRRLVATTAGELVDRPADLSGALGALAGRSMLWYRTDRLAGGAPVPLVVHAPDDSGKTYRTAAWAPAQ